MALSIFTPHPKDCACDLCEAQAKKRRDDQKRERNEPTLTHRPFEKLVLVKPTEKPE